MNYYFHFNFLLLDDKGVYRGGAGAAVPPRRPVNSEIFSNLEQKLLQVIIIFWTLVFFHLMEFLV